MNTQSIVEVDPLDRVDRFHAAPLTIWNIWTGLRIAKATFRREWPMVAMTYAWHLLRARGVPLTTWMVRRMRFDIDLEGVGKASVEVLATRIHEPDIRWVRVGLSNPVPVAELCRALFDAMPKCRLLVLETPRTLGQMHGPVCWAHVGTLPGDPGPESQLYAVRREAMLATRAAARVTATRHEALVLETQFHVLYKKRVPIAITGLYVLDWWPHIGWGGWAAIDPKFARLRAGESALSATLELARGKGCRWFCTETSGSPEYRVARRFFEYCRMPRIVTIADFFQDGDIRSEERDYIVYAKNLQSCGLAPNVQRQPYP